MDKDDISQKHKEVHSWLSGIFEGEDPPNYEVNKQTVRHLHKLMKHNIEMDRIATLAVADANEKTEEYTAEAARLHDILEDAGMSAHVLSNAGKASLKNLTDLAGSLKIKDVKKSSFILGLSDLMEQLASTKQEIVEKKRNIQQLKKQYKECTTNLGSINMFYEKIEESSFVDVPVLEKRQRDTRIFNEKTISYKNQIEEFEANGEIEERQKYLHHDVLLKISQQLDGMKHELIPLQKKHKSYRSLPPDISLAKVKIEETKRQLMKLEKQLQSDIDLLAF